MTPGLLVLLHVMLCVAVAGYLLQQVILRGRAIDARLALPCLLAMLCYLYVSDYALHGAGAYITRWSRPELWRLEAAHMRLLAILAAMTLALSFLHSVLKQDASGFKPQTQTSIFAIVEDRTAAKQLTWCALIILLCYALFVFRFHGYSIAAVADGIFAARSERLSDVRFLSGGVRNPLFSIAESALPGCVAILGGGYALGLFRWPVRGLLLASFIVGAVFLFASGSRTVFVLSFLPLGLVFAKRLPPSLRLPLLVGGCIALFAASSVMYQFRSGGLAQLREAQDISIGYHQDNNFALTVHALDRAATTTERVPSLKFWQTALLNWVPRAVWPGKPLLTAQDYQGYKETWWTQGFVGEFVALYGPLPGAALSTLYICALYLLLLWALRKSSWQRRPMTSLLSVPIVLIYVYMCLRSCLNISQFMYVLLPFAVVGLLSATSKALKRRAMSVRL
ncbi:MAG: hypothetical protein AAF337_02915 [Pseudomonadota bacterium]